MIKTSGIPPPAQPGCSVDLPSVNLINSNHAAIALLELLKRPLTSPASSFEAEAVALSYPPPHNNEPLLLTHIAISIGIPTFAILITIAIVLVILVIGCFVGACRRRARTKKLKAQQAQRSRQSTWANPDSAPELERRRTKGKLQKKVVRDAEWAEEGFDPEAYGTIGEVGVPKGWNADLGSIASSHSRQDLISSKHDLMGSSRAVS